MKDIPREWIGRKRRGSGLPYSRYRLFEEELCPKGICYIVAEEIFEEDAIETLDDLLSYCFQNGAREVLFSFGEDGFEPALRSSILGRYRFRHSSDINILRKELCDRAASKDGEDVPCVRMKRLTNQTVRMYTDYYNATFIDVPNAMTRSGSDIERDRNDPGKELGFFVKDGIPIGIYQIDYSETPDISAISILEPFRNKGFGQTCLGMLEQRIVMKGYRECRLLVASTNLPAVRLYARMGYVFERTLSVWYSMRKRDADPSVNDEAP